MIAPARVPPHAPVHDSRGGLDHLGPEFLTWLWWRSVTDPCFVHPDGTEVFLHVDEHLEFRGERAASRRTVLRAGAPGASAESRVALRSGKLVTAARLLLARGEDEVHLTLKAEDFDVSGVRLPVSKDGGHRERLETALENLETLWDDLDLCYAAFLAVRTAPDWPEEAERIRAGGREPSAEE